MNWDYRWDYVAVFVGTFVVLALFVVWLIKRLLSFWLSKDIDAYKHKLALESAQNLQELKKKMRASSEQQVTFYRLQEKQAEVISELYGLLQGMHLDLELLEMIAKGAVPNKIAPDVDRLCDILEKKWRDCFSYYYKHILFFSDQINQLMPQAVDYHPYLAEVHYGDFGENLASAREQVATWRAEHDKVQLILSQLKTDFEKLTNASLSTSISKQADKAIGREEANGGAPQ
jgi:hypothetical protein